MVKDNEKSYLVVDFEEKKEIIFKSSKSDYAVAERDGINLPPLFLYIENHALGVWFSKSL
jgi:hypothetical protein